jgi:hypothetical protein
MQKKRGRPRLPQESKTEPGKVVSARISPEDWQLLETARIKNKRTLSREIAARLQDSLGHYRKSRASLPPRVRGLLDAVAFTARVIEAATGKLWNEDRYTAQHLAEAIGYVIGEFSPKDKVVTLPPKVVERAKAHVAGRAYPTRLGEEEARGVVAWLRLTPGPEEVGPPHYPEFWMEFSKIQRNLQRGRK